MLKVSVHSTTEDEIMRKLNKNLMLFMVYSNRIYQSPVEPTELLSFTEYCVFHFRILELNVCVDFTKY